MSLKVYNTLSRVKEPFETIEPGKVSMYLCGPTVYKPAHIGHMVGPVIFDTVKRYLSYSGYQVTWVVNITDVDDKLINRANETDTTVEKLAREMAEDYFENLASMGVDGVDHFPYATAHIHEMQDMIQSLVDSGCAYPMEGDVYFETSKDEDYGKLSHRSIDEMMSGTRVEANDRKHHPADFALWKKSKPDEPAWDSPWGPGRPGWHIECSAMSRKILGESIDIHGGGLDLMFPHHENELAQSESCHGKPFAKYWMHNGLMQAGKSAGKLGGDHDRHGDMVENMQAQEANKLAGSKGADSVKLLFEKFAPETVRFFLLSTHYRSPMEFSDRLLAESEKSLDGFYRLFEMFERITGTDFYALEVSGKRETGIDLKKAPAESYEELRQFHQRFIETMDDDFNTGGAVGILFELRKWINGYITQNELDKVAAASDENNVVLSDSMKLLKELAQILGVFRKPLEDSVGGDDEFVDKLMQLVIELRETMRKEKNFAMSDFIRDRLTQLNVTLEDRTEGTGWRRD